MPYTHREALVSGEWLQAHLDDPEVRIIDATYHLPHAERDAYEEWTYRHIQGAVHFDIDKIADTATDLPHMLPSADVFAKIMSDFGIGNNHKIVVYDANGGYMAACRVWWMLRTFGYKNAAILNGGMVRWGKERRPLEHEEPKITPATFTAAFDPALVKTKADMLANIENGESLVVDARSEGRFTGVDHEPHKTERVGHIPKSLNVPFTLITPPAKDFTFEDANAIATIFKDRGVDMAKPAIITCGSGVTACVVAFAMHILGKEDAAIYDGSWAEWGESADVPIAT